MALFNRVTIIGLGLIGGSLGMAIRRKRLAREVVGCSRNPLTLRQAKRRGAIDWGTTDLSAAVRGADVVVLATPVDTIVPIAKRAARAMRPGSVITDVGSTKGRIVRALERALPRTIAFVGSHPLAGSERRGIAAAEPTVFAGSVCIVTQTLRTNPRALRTVTRLWNAVVTRVVVMDPQAHDRVLASVSHLPHLLAFALMGATDGRARAVAPRSFLDATRVAKSDPDLWDDIFLSNHHALLRAIGRFDRQWAHLRRAIAAADRQTLRRLLRHAGTIRHALRDR